MNKRMKKDRRMKPMGKAERKEKINMYRNNQGIFLRGNVLIRFSQKEVCQGDTDVRHSMGVCGRVTAAGSKQLLLRYY